MNILKLKILKKGDRIEKVENNEVHVRKKNGDYLVYKMKQLKQNKTSIYVYDLFVVTKGTNVIEVIEDADVDDIE